LTGDFLYLEGEIDNFALQYEDQPSGTNSFVMIRKGKHAGLGEQLALIDAKASELRQKAAQDRFGLILPGRAERAGFDP
jgi:hypothetical protein